MQRDPSLHIKLSEFIKVVRKVGLDELDLEKICQVFKVSAAHSVSTRTVQVSNKRMETKTGKIIQSSRLDGDVFSSIIYAVRKQLHHRGVTLTKPGSKDWDSIKEAASNALDFCNEFNLPRRQGFQEYIKIGISKMNTFNIHKFPSLYESICKTYEAVSIINGDEEPAVTKLLYQEYSSLILSNTGIFEDMTNDPERYVFFVHARRQAKELNVALDVYTKAQFDGLSFTNGIPYPSQLTGKKAIERLYKYLYKEGLKIDNN